VDVPRPLRRTPLGLRGFSGTDFRKRLTQRPVLKRATIVEPVIRQLCREIELNSPSIKVLKLSVSADPPSGIPLDDF
jgi:hypothetical protein